MKKRLFAYKLIIRRLVIGHAKALLG